MFSVVSRLCFLSLKPTVSAKNCRSVSRDAKDRMTRPFPRLTNRGPSEAYDKFEDGAMEDVEDKIQNLFNKERRREKTVKHHRLKRQMTPSGAPKRTLTRDAMEQIRYLSKNRPEEWTVEDLAKGFSVDVDIILRVLKSKFSPPPQKMAKQDSKVMLNLRQQALPAAQAGKMGQVSQQLLDHSTPAKLPTGTSQSLVSRRESSKDLVTLAKPVSLGTLPNQPLLSSTVKSKHLRMHRSRQDLELPVKDDVSEDVNTHYEECWDGQVLSEEKFKELVFTKCSPVVQDGKCFFDSDGNFLYKI